MDETPPVQEDKVGEKGPETLHNGEVVEESLMIARELARQMPKAAIYRVIFKLAQQLKSLRGATSPAQFESAVKLFAELSGRQFEQCWYSFWRKWKKVKHPDKEKLLSWANRMAQAEPYPLKSGPGGEKFTRVVSIAWHLARLRTPRPFCLPREQVGKLLGVHHTTVSDIVKLVEDAGLIKATDGKYSRVRGKAKDYYFTGEMDPASRNSA
jgi:hypothetical protein